jgi:hypothetical protein
LEEAARNSSNPFLPNPWTPTRGRIECQRETKDVGRDRHPAKYLHSLWFARGGLATIKIGDTYGLKLWVRRLSPKRTDSAQQSTKLSRNLPHQRGTILAEANVR